MELPLKRVIDERFIRKNGTCIVYIQYHYTTRKRTLLNTQIVIPPLHWNYEEGFITDTLPPEYGNAEELNAELRRMYRAAEESIKQKLRAPRSNQSLQHKEVVYPVQVKDQQMTIGILDSIPHADKSAASFFGIGSNSEDYPISTSVAAVIPEPQMLVTGSVIKFRLCDDIYVNGVLIPKDNLVFGVASLNDERLQIEITSIRYRQNIFPVKLEVYDLDGLAGIYIPGAISREVAKQSTDNSLQAIEMTTMDPSLKAQAAAAGIGAAKSLISKKVKLIRVTVKAGYKVLLRDKQSNY